MSLKPSRVRLLSWQQWSTPALTWPMGSQWRPALVTAYPLLQPTEHLPGFALPLASIADLMCMKLSAIAGRGARRDFWGLHALLQSSGIGLEKALELYSEKYPVDDLGHVLKSLVYFADAEQEPMPQALSPTRWNDVKAYFQRGALAVR